MMALRDDSFRFLFLGCRGDGSRVFAAVLGPLRWITGIMWLVACVLSGIAIWVGLVKGMNLKSARVIPEDREDEE